MQKLLKRVVLAFTLAVAALCACAFTVACNADSKDYVVTVVYEDNTPVNGKTGTAGLNGDTIMVQICDADNELRCYQLIPLGEDGKASVAADVLEAAISGATNFHVKLTGLPAGYTCSDSYTVSTSSRSVTITLVAA